MKTRLVSLQHFSLVSALFILLLFLSVPVLNAQEEDSLSKQERRISLSEYRDKMMGGWIGQMVGVGWGAPTEFAYLSRIIPNDEIPAWEPGLVNVYNQDDLYVEMTFLRTMEEHGIGVSIKQAGIDFANSEYLLWVANRVGRTNLRNGIAPPNSGHPEFNYAADAIDYQIEADYSGLIAPGMPDVVIELGNKFGRLMNYGDGLYGGMFVGAMYAEAFFESNINKIIDAGLAAIPDASQYAEAVRDVVIWHSEYPDDFEKTWNLINDKYHLNPDYRRFTSSAPGAANNIDAKLNGAYIVMGLLYGEGDTDKTVIESMRCGQDSDCNPSNAAGILFTTIGYKNLPERYISGLERDVKFSFTDYNFDELVDVCEKFALEFTKQSGGRIEKGDDGEQYLVIPVKMPVPNELEQSFDPGPLSDNEFTRAELRQIKGSKLYRYILLVLVVLAIFVFKDNRDVRSAALLIPFTLAWILLELIHAAIPPDLSGTVDVASIFKTLIASMAMLLLIGRSLAGMKRYMALIVSLLLIVLVGFVGALGASEGRYIASTKITLVGYLVISVLWLIGIALVIRLNYRKHTRLRFNLLTILCLFVVNIAGVYLLLLGFSQIAGPWSRLGTSITAVVGGSLVFTILQYLFTLPYLILVYTNTVYGRRFADIIRKA
jgi:hypothetical protein